VSDEPTGRGGGNVLSGDSGVEEPWKEKPFEVVFRERFGGETPEEAAKQALEYLSKVVAGEEVAQLKVLQHMKDPQHSTEMKAYFYLIQSKDLL
jgi:hypothetical protein